MSLSRRVRFAVLTRDRFTCRYCGRSAPDVVLHVDHVHPRSRGGSDKMENLVTACSDCNGAKSDKILPMDVAALAPKAPPKLVRDDDEVPHSARCVACHMPRRSLRNDWLVLNDNVQLEGPLEELPVNYLVHGPCVDTIGDRGYSIRLDRIVSAGDARDPFASRAGDSRGDSLAGWIAHLRDKNWFESRDEDWLKIAHQEANRLARRAANG